jgi:hypothetical protein
MLICGFAKKHVWLKNFLVIWNMIASLGSLWLQKLKLVIAKSCWLISVTPKKEKEN